MSPGLVDFIKLVVIFVVAPISFEGVLVTPHGALLLADDACCIVLHLQYLVELGNLQSLIDMQLV